MTFNTAVSGLRAADMDLSVIGNNIANASTTGYKQSRAEFADIYASAALGGGSGTVGSGVGLSAVTQQFNQGSIAFTNNSLDMAINGNGFFILDNDGATEYTRVGIFGLDQEGYLVNSQEKRLQGFAANAAGTIAGNLSDLHITTDNITPRQTTDVGVLVNLDARQTEPAERGTTAQTLGASIGVAQPSINNGYPVETATFTLPDGSTRTVSTSVNDSAATTASAINALPNVSATATTTMTLSNISENSGTLQITLNGAAVGTPGAISAQNVAIAINSLTNTTLRGISATYDNATDTVTVMSNSGDDLEIGINNTADPLDTISVTGTSGAAVDLTGDGAAGLNATVGGTIDITMDENVTMTSDGGGAALFDDPIVAAPFENNSFNPDDQDTYNHATSVNVFDSLGNAHVMTLYYVKESAQAGNTWTMYVQIDGENVGDPNTALPAPQNEEPTLASFTVVFNDNGTLDTGGTDPIQITYWNPVDEDGNDNGALQGLTIADGAAFPLVEPLTSSNFVIDLSGSTQFGSDFAVNDISQDGYTTGRLTDVDISAQGMIFARYTNGQSRPLGQLAIANFRNQQGLQPIGNTAWAETFSSGNPVIGAPGSASLGVIQSGAIEESNVELSEQLVNLIEAQRNFQANAKTIQTGDAVTQAIINIR